MENKVKKYIFLILFIILSIASIILVGVNEIKIALFTILFSIFLLILLIKEILDNKSPESIFNGQVSNILKTYETILVEVDNIPNLKDKKITKTLSFKDIVNLEYEYRKPVYFVHNNESYDFILINKDDVYTYTIKLDSEKNSLLETYFDKLSYIENSDSDLDIIDSLDKTTVIRINGSKQYLVSPVKDKKEKKDNKEEPDKDDSKISNTPDDNV